MPAQLSLLVLRCEDIGKSVAFYRAIGFDFKAEKHGAGTEHFACESEGLVFELYPLHGESSIGDELSRLGFRVKSLQSVGETLRMLGIRSQIKTSLWGVRLLTQDPDGRIVELAEFETVRRETDKV